MHNTNPMQGLWETMDGLRGAFEQRVGGFGGTGAARKGRGDVRAAILALLAEEPMHGYQLIHEIERRSEGTWKPSAGSVYPTLQLLNDEGLVIAEEANGKKTYALTDTGRAAAEASDGSLPWESTTTAPDAARPTVLPKAAANLAQAVMQVGRSGTQEQIDEAVALLDSTRRAVYAILARD